MINIYIDLFDKIIFMNAAIVHVLIEHYAKWGFQEVKLMINLCPLDSKVSRSYKQLSYNTIKLNLYINDSGQANCL